jgi:hypothetical protein
VKPGTNCLSSRVNEGHDYWNEKLEARVAMFYELRTAQALCTVFSPNTSDVLCALRVASRLALQWDFRFTTTGRYSLVA